MLYFSSGEFTLIFKIILLIGVIDNTGFDVRGDIKIFDFGLATELYPHLEVGNELYLLTGCTGSLRYMAPEVRWCLPYNCRADVYSFGIVFWQICSTLLPFSSFNREQFDQRVLRDGLRPKMQSWWPNSSELYSKMQSCWEVESSKRVDLSNICNWLSHELSLIRGEDVDSTRKVLELRRSSMSTSRRSSNSRRSSTSRFSNFSQRLSLRSSRTSFHTAYDF